MEKSIFVVPVVAFTGNEEKIIYLNARFITALIALTVFSFEIQLFSAGEVFSINARGDLKSFILVLEGKQSTEYWNWFCEHEKTHKSKVVQSKVNT